MSRSPTSEAAQLQHNQSSRSDADWWKSGVFYQVYPRSFRDTNGDGVGDLQGVIRGLDYIRDLGADALWLSPFYPSPQVDAGYDVSNYCDVDPLFGTLEDFDELLKQAHSRGLRVIIDLVPNHSSDRHPLFQAAVAAGRGSRERSLYHFAEGRGSGGTAPPSNWQSVFGGTSWTRVEEPDGSPGQWYYHLFAPEQPDFNWENPAVLDFFQTVLRFWLDRGVDGFRIDVSDALIKDTSWPDTSDKQPVIPKDEDSGVHEIYRHLRQTLDEFPGTMAVIETGAEDHVVAQFLRHDEMHQAFNFRFLKAPWDAEHMARAISESVSAFESVGSPTTWVIDNHDNIRSVTRYAQTSALKGAYVPEGADATHLSSEEEATGNSRARAITMLYLALPGSAYIYAGQELGLPEVTDLPEDVLQDPLFFRTEGSIRGRDGCRIPLPWEGTAPPFGFSSSASTWLPQPSEWAHLTVENEADQEDSMLTLYRKMLDLRRSHASLGTGRIQAISTAEGAAESEVLEVRLVSDGREGPIDPVRVLVNFGSEAYPIPKGRVLLTSRPLTSSFLPADCCVLIAES